MNSNMTKTIGTFDRNFDFSSDFDFLTKNLSFDRNFCFDRNFDFFTKIFIFLWTIFIFTELSIRWQIFLFSPKFWFFCQKTLIYFEEFWQNNNFIFFRLVERGRIKCHNYWPEDGETQVWGYFTVRDTSDTIVESHFRRQKLELEYESQTREIFHFQFTQVTIDGRFEYNLKNLIFLSRKIYLKF